MYTGDWDELVRENIFETGEKINTSSLSIQHAIDCIYFIHNFTMMCI